MTPYEKITTHYTERTDAAFEPEGTIMLQNDSDSNGDYIKEWNHPTLAKPTQEQLDGVQ